MPETIAFDIVPRLVDALEQMAFVWALPLDAPPPAPPSPLMVRIGFRGPLCMRIELITGEGLGQLMAANILGPECTDAPFRARDALKELLNVTCGALLAQWPAGEGRFEMSIPEIVPLETSAWDRLLGEGDFSLLEAEGHPLGIRLADRNGK